jgi:aspartate/methionine/tyrosine aminotransferase
MSSDAINITGELKMAARRRGEDIIDMSMGNPDGATPRHIVDKLVEAAQRQDTHGYSVSKGIPRLRRAISTNEGGMICASVPDAMITPVASCRS